MKEKAFELRQKRTALVAENRELVERAEKESRTLTADEQAKFDGNDKDQFALAQRISTIERQVAVDGLGDETAGRRSAPLPHEDAGNAHGRRYSMLRAIKCLSEKRPIDGLEAEVSQEMARRCNKSPQGFFMPFRTNAIRESGEVPHDFSLLTGERRAAERHAAERRALDTTAGTGSIPSILSKDWIEILRNKMQVMAAGATEITDLQGRFAIPRQSAKATAYWVAESGAPSGSNQTLDQVLFTPKTVGAFTDISRRFFELTNLDSGEEFVKSDLTAVLARGVDLAALNGGGTNDPLGLLQNSAVTTSRIVSLGAAGGAPTWATLVEMHTIVARGNAADLGGLGYMGNADVEGTLATTIKAGTTFPIFLLEDGKVYSKPFYATQQLPNNLTKTSGSGLSPIIYGAWSQLVLAYWSGVDILVDPYTGSSSGTVRVVALQDMDIQVRHNEAFSFILDMATNQAA